MPKIHRKNPLSIIMIFALTGLLFLSIVIFFISLAKNSKIRRDIGSKHDTLSQFAANENMPVSQESVTFLIEERNMLKGICARFKLALTSPLNEEITGEELDPLQFKERLIQTQKKLREDAARQGLALPELLGFKKYDTELSKASEIPHLIYRIKVIEELIYLMIDSGVASLDEVVFTGAVAGAEGRTDKTVPKAAKVAEEDGVSAALMAKMKEAPGADVSVKSAYFDVAVSLAIGCTSPELLNFLYKLRVSQYIFVVEKMDIERVDNTGSDKSADSGPVEGKLKVKLSVKAVALDQQD